MDDPTAFSTRDPLLSIAYRLTQFVRFVISVAGVGLLAAIPFVFVMRSDLVGKFVEEGFQGDRDLLPWAVTAAMLAGLILLALVWAFVRILEDLINTVRTGEPFAPQNADRLARMGWLALAFQAAGLLMAGAGAWLAALLKGMPDVKADVDVGFTTNGLVLALILFILSRIFRHGAAMRADLEGTV